jgi:acyl carrier protein
MQRSDVVEQLKHYIAETVLDGKDVGLNESTPLLEWGVINSFEIMRLLYFIQQQFHVEIPSEKVIADHFVNLAVLSDLVMEQASGIRR